MVEPLEEQIRRLVRLADKSTKDLGDTETRRIAYQTVLSHLLERGIQTVERPSLHQERSSRLPPRVPRLRAHEGPSSWVLRLIEEGFFDKPRVIGDVVTRLGEVGHTVLSKDVSYPLARFCDLRRLRRNRSGKDLKGRVVWSYTNY